MYEVEPVVAAGNKLGEGPLWSGREQALYWLDIHQGRVERFCPATSERTTYVPEQAVTALGLRRAGGFVAATRAGFALWSPPAPPIEVLGHPEQHMPHNRFNDGAVDPAGNFWAGTMYEGPDNRPADEGCLYKLDPARAITRMEAGLTISNGIGWSLDGRTMYFTDTLRHTIYAYDFDPASGSIANRRPLVCNPEEDGYPDGLAVDAEGCIWSARWAGWRVTRYDPAGQAMLQVKMPVACPTSCAFGGPDLDELYITSAWTALSPAERQDQPLAGDLFRVRPGVRGRSPFEFAG